MEASAHEFETIRKRVVASRMSETIEETETFSTARKAKDLLPKSEVIQDEEAQEKDCCGASDLPVIGLLFPKPQQQQQPPKKPAGCEKRGRFLVWPVARVKPSTGSAVQSSALPLEQTQQQQQHQ